VESEADDLRSGGTCQFEQTEVEKSVLQEVRGSLHSAVSGTTGFQKNPKIKFKDLLNLKR
jgi:hypothetical protein